MTVDTGPDEQEPRAPGHRPRGDDPLPWEGKPRRVDVLCWLGITLSGVYALALLPLVPSLLGTNPVLLAALRGSTSAMVTSGAFARVGEASLAVAILAPIPMLLLFDPFYWWAGRLWGRRAIDLFTGRRRRSRRWIDRIERNARWLGPPAVTLAYVLPVPSALVYAAAGWTGMSLAVYLLCDLLGTLMWVGLNVGLGYAIGQSAVDVAKAISRYALVLTLFLVAVVVIVSVRRARRLPAPGE